MAFDAAASGDFGGRGGGGNFDALLNGLSRSVIALTQTIDIIDKLVKALGSAADSPTLRARLASAENKADSLRAELDSGTRKLRVEGMSGMNPAQAASAERVLQQYAELRRRLLETLRSSQARQKQFRAPHPGDAVEVVMNPAGPSGSGSAGKAYPQRGAGFGEAIELSALKSLDDVDEAILEERRKEAEAIAKEAVEVQGVMRDLSGLVHEQGETLTKVEENVTTSRDTVIKANRELEQAAAYQRSYRRKCCFFWIIFLIIIGIAVAIIVPLVEQAKNSTNGKR